MKFRLLSLVVFSAITTLAIAQGTIKNVDEVPTEEINTEEIISSEDLSIDGIEDDALKGMEGPIMEFQSSVVDYGTIDQDSEPLRVLSFVNTGTEPLVIKNARGSCGCTVPIWPQEPIMPGEESKIEIRYATNRLGKFSKTVKITTNEVSKPHVITVKGNVLKPENDDSVPTSTPNMIK